MTVVVVIAFFQRFVKLHQMKHFWITFFSGIVFFVTVLLVGPLTVFSGAVSRETAVEDASRETFSVQQGVSQDGLLAITAVPAVPSIPPRMKAANHERTLRAFIAPNRGGVLTLYLERAKPREYYALLGSFHVTEKYPVLTWASSTVLVFYGTAPDGTVMRCVVDVHLLVFSQTPIEPSLLPIAPLHLENVLP
jgi:hypothetical protein